MHELARTLPHQTIKILSLRWLDQILIQNKENLPWKQSATYLKEILISNEEIFFPERDYHRFKEA